MTAPVHLLEAERVVAAFGGWPSFHDATLLAVERPTAGVVILALLAFRMTDKVDARGYFELVDHHLVRLRFDGVVDDRLPAQPDTLFSLEIGDQLGDNGRFLVVVESALGNPDEGRGGSFRARTAAVIEVSPQPA